MKDFVNSLTTKDSLSARNTTIGFALVATITALFAAIGATVHSYLNAATVFGLPTVFEYIMTGAMLTTGSVTALYFALLLTTAAIEIFDVIGEAALDHYNNRRSD